MGFGILAGSFSRGVNNGINAANSLQERKDRKDRQATLDQRYQDSQARRDRLDVQNENRYRDSLDHRTKQEGIAESHYNKATEATATYRKEMSKRADAGLKLKQDAAGMVRTRFDNSQSDRAAKKEQEMLANKLRVILGKGIKTTGEAMTALMATPGEGQDIMDSHGVHSVRFEPYASKDAKGNDTQLFAVLGQKQGDESGNEYLIGKDGPIDSPDGNYQGLSQAGLVALASHHMGAKDTNNLYSALNTVIAERGKLSDREKLKLNHDNKMSERKPTVKTVTNSDFSTSLAQINNDGTFTTLKEKGIEKKLPQQAASVLKEGVSTTFGNGQVWTLQNGQPVRVK